jgi:hypothetical protein
MTSERGGVSPSSESLPESRDPQSFGLADLRDQIVRLQQQWRSRGEAQRSPFYSEPQKRESWAWDACADDLDPLLTLVRSVIEHGQETETEKGKP